MQMSAEIFFNNIYRANTGADALAEYGFTIEDLGGDDLSDIHWLRARINVEMAADDFFDWIRSIIGPDPGIDSAGPEFGLH